MKNKKLNVDLRKLIMEMVFRSSEGHIPSSFSIIDIIEHIYSKVLCYDKNQLLANDRDIFVLSKGHGAAALYAVLYKEGVLSSEDLLNYSTRKGILGGHPDATKVPGAEASTGSLGHGFPMATGMALGKKIKGYSGRVFALLGDGECNEGTIWEAALVGAKRELGNLIAIVDLNGSAKQILPVDPLADKWAAFGWETYEVNGHDAQDLERIFTQVTLSTSNRPKAIVAHTVKGKGVSFVEGHGVWHHKIPSKIEMEQMLEELV